MPRTLEIHHIDVGQGDSTLILVRNPAPAFPNGIELAALIDAGKLNQGPVVDAYLTARGVTRLNILVASHYDIDHFNGLRAILALGGAAGQKYRRVRIYDRGEEGQLDRFGTPANRSDDFIRYLDAAACGDPYYSPTNARNSNPRRPNRTRVTAWVNSFGAGVSRAPQAWTTGINSAAAQTRPPVDANGYAQWRAANWLVTQGDLFGLAPLGGIPAPTMTCIATNQYVRNAGGNVFVFGGLAADDNRMSLGFLIRFNNFRYYTAGDLETPQEDLLGTFLNQANNDAGHVCAFKLGHHGSAESTSAAFANRIRPRTGFVSSGFNNGFDHPRLAPLNNSNAQVQYLYLSSCGGPTGQHNLMGCTGGDQIANDAQDRVAGNAGAGILGHIVLSVTDVQSQANPHQFSVSYWDLHDPTTPNGGDVPTAFQC